MKAADQKLVQEYPLGIQFPRLEGKYLLLNWWTHSEQNHVSVARTEDQIVRIFELLLKHRDWDEAKPTAYFEIDIVTPPEKLQLKAARLRRRQEIDSFSWWIAHQLDQLGEGASGLVPLPEGFSRCAKYRPEEGIEIDDWMRENHTDCQNCTSGFVFDAKAQYALKRDKYRQASGYKYPRGSQAPLADPKKPLFHLVDRHGHHSDGSILAQIKADDNGFFQEVKFFCHATKLPIPERITKLREAMDAKWAAQRAKEEKERDQERVQEVAASIARARDLFK